jgi:hypothetical protein
MRVLFTLIGMILRRAFYGNQEERPAPNPAPHAATKWLTSPKRREALRRCKNTQSVKETLKTLTFFLLKFCKPLVWEAKASLVYLFFI